MVKDTNEESFGNFLGQACQPLIAALVIFIALMICFPTHPATLTEEKEVTKSGTWQVKTLPQEADKAQFQPQTSQKEVTQSRTRQVKTMPRAADDEQSSKIEESNEDNVKQPEEQPSNETVPEELNKVQPETQPSDYTVGDAMKVPPGEQSSKMTENATDDEVKGTESKKSNKGILIWVILAAAVAIILLTLKVINNDRKKFQEDDDNFAESKNETVSTQRKKQKGENIRTAAAEQEIATQGAENFTKEESMSASTKEPASQAAKKKKFDPSKILTKE